MKIVRLDLERFGHFTGRHLDFLAEARDGDGRSVGGLCLVYGENEAGKTTVLDAVRGLLFGFPTQSRYAVDFDPSLLSVGALLEFERGVSVQVRRTRGRGETLHGTEQSGGGDVNGDWLHGKMGRPTRALFENVFGFSLEGLAQGAKGLEQGGVSQAMFAGGLGGSIRLDTLVEGLRRDGDAIFTEKGRTKPLVNVGIAKVEELRKATRMAITRSEEWERLNAQLDAAQKHADTVHRRLRGLRRELARRLSVHQGLEPFRALRAAREELAGLDAPLGFPPDSGDRYQRLVEMRDRFTHDAREQESLALAAEAEIATTNVDHEILGHAEAIEALYRGLDAYRTRVGEVPICLDRLDRMRVHANARLGELRVGWDLSIFDKIHIDSPRRAELERLVARDRSLDEQRRRTQEEITTLERDLRQVTAEVSPPPQYSEAELDAWRAWLEGWSGYVAEKQEQSRKAVALALLEKKCALLRAKLDPPLSVAVPGAETLPVPRVEDVERFEGEWSACGERVGRLHEAAAAHAQELSGIETDLALLVAEGPTPSEQELRAVRVDRDRLFRRLIAECQSGSPANGPAAAAFEAMSAEADRTADQMRQRADAVQRRALLEASRVRAQRAHQDCMRSLEAAIGQQRQVEARWLAAWSGGGLCPLSPGAMRGWLHDRALFLAAIEGRDAASAHQAELVTRTLEYVEWGRRLDGAGAGRIEQTRARALRRLEEHREVDRLERENRVRAERDRLRLTDARKRLAVLDEERVAFEDEWSALCAAMGIGAGLVVAAGMRLAEGLAQAKAEFTATDLAENDRLARARTEISTYEALVHAMTGPMGAKPEGTSDPANAVQRLYDALHIARGADMRVRELTERSRLARDRANGAVRRREEAIESIHQLRLLLPELDLSLVEEATIDACFMTMAQRAARAAAVRQTMVEAEHGLRRHQGSWEADEYQLALAEAESETIQEDVPRLEREVTAAESQARDADNAVGEWRANVERIDGSARAAEALDALEVERTTLRAQIDRYGVLTLAQTLLEEAIARFERDHQPELLGRATLLFATMTGGRYTRVARRFEGDPAKSLQVQRQDGRLVSPEVLSTGTREQLYLSIRLAYIDHYRRTAEPLPVVLDDVLVNFDDQRCRATLTALAEFSAHTQVLLFTCHAHLVELARASVPNAVSLTIPR